MDLLALLQAEIASKKITNKLKIAQYIYYRTGEIFEYDPLWAFSNLNEKNQLKLKRINIHYVKDYNITCFSWSILYIELLRHFGIYAKPEYIFKNLYDKKNKKEIKIADHAYVNVFIDKKMYIADLTASHHDMKNIKFGMDTCYNCQFYKDLKTKEYHKENDECEIIKRSIKTEEVLKKLKKELLAKNISDDCYELEVYNLIENIMNFPRKKIGYVMGKKFIDYLMLYFLGKGYNIPNTHFYNKEIQDYVEVYTILVNGKPCYFIYQEFTDGLYYFRETNLENVNYYCKYYDSRLTEHLKLQRIR